MRRLALTFLLIASGCTEEVAACPAAGEVFDGTRCVPATGMDAGPEEDDAGPDDAGTEDAGFDAGACFMIDCAPMVCDPDDGNCVECVVDADCGEIPDRPDCDEDSNRCVAGCATSGCDHVTGNPHCRPTDEMVCVACVTSSEGEDCPSGDACDPRRFECTGTEIGTLGLCSPCRASSECGDVPDEGDMLPAVCAELRWLPDDRSLGFSCLVDYLAAGNRCPRGTRRLVNGMPTAEGTMVDVCAPVATTTCAAQLDTRRCSTASECGVEEIEDAACIMGECESLCTSDGDALDCPGTQTCASFAGTFACNG